MRFDYVIDYVINAMRFAYLIGAIVGSNYARSASMNAVAGGEGCSRWMGLSWGSDILNSYSNIKLYHINT